jgi:hypothetical protein
MMVGSLPTDVTSEPPDPARLPGSGSDVACHLWKTVEKTVAVTTSG